MATFLDATVLGYFKPVATFLLVWVIAYGALQTVSPFGDDTQGLNALVAFAVAILTILTAPALSFLQYVLPWMAVVAIAFFFLAFTFMALGADMEWIQENILAGSMGWVIFIGVVLALFGLGHALGGGNQQTSPQQTSPPIQQNLSQEELEQRYEQRQGEPGQAPSDRPPRQQQTQGSEPLPQELDEEGNSFAARIIYVFTHPQVLGLLFLLLLAALTIANLAGQN